jgi:hypothetical protein
MLAIVSTMRIDFRVGSRRVPFLSHNINFSLREFPPLFEEFRATGWSLLWRGSRDGFSTDDFHSRANTLKFIRDTNGNVFGGFTPTKWEWRTQSP